MIHDSSAETIAAQLPVSQRDLYEAFRRTGVGPAAALEGALAFDCHARLAEAEERAKRDQQAEQAAAGLGSESRALFETFREQGNDPRRALRMLEGRDEPTGPRNLTEGFLQAQSAALGARRSPSFSEMRERLDGGWLDRARGRSTAEAPELDPPPTDEERRAARKLRFWHERSDQLREVLPISAALEQAELEAVVRLREQRSTSTRSVRLRESAADSFTLARFDESENEELRRLIGEGLSIREAIAQVEGGQS